MSTVIIQSVGIQCFLSLPGFSCVSTRNQLTTTAPDVHRATGNTLNNHTSVAVLMHQQLEMLSTPLKRHFHLRFLLVNACA